VPESAINYTPGSGGKAHAFNRTIGGVPVDESVVIAGEQYLPTYCATATAVSGAGTGHLMQLMAGSALNVRIRRIVVRQVALATIAGLSRIQFVRLLTAGTGGTSVTAGKYDNGDAAAGATGMTLPSVLGTEDVVLYSDIIGLVAVNPSTTLNRLTWEARPDMKSIVIPAGTANGLVLKNGGLAGVTFDIDIEFVETAWL
jgi:hypothetical protein